MIAAMVRDAVRLCEARHEQLTREAVDLEAECGGRQTMASTWLFFGAAWVRVGAEVLRALER